MSKLDNRIRAVIRAQAPTMPEFVSNAYDDQIKKLTTRVCPNTRELIFHQIKMYTRVALTACLLIIFILINVNGDVAFAMQDIPVLGNIFKVITIREYEYDNGNQFVDAKIPMLSGDTECLQQTESINKSVESLIDMILKEFGKEVEAYPSSYKGVSISYDVLTNTQSWFTLRLNVMYTAGSTSTEYKFYHIDKQQNKIVTLQDLFEPNYDYVTVITENIRSQMKEQMKKDSNMVYYFDADNVDGFGSIDINQNFYLNENNNIVIVFDKYEVAPGYMGCPEFVVDVKEKLRISF